MGEDLLESSKQKERCWAIIYDCLSGLTVRLCLPRNHATNLVQRKHVRKSPTEARLARLPPTVSVESGRFHLWLAESQQRGC